MFSSSFRKSPRIVIQNDILAGIGLVVSLIVAVIALAVAAVVRAQTSDSFPAHGGHQFAYIFSPAQQGRDGIECRAIAVT